MAGVRWNTENVRKYIEDNSDCKLVSEYKKWDEKITLKCKCGKTFDTLLHHFRSANKRQCNNCGLKKRPRRSKYDYDKVKHEVESQSGCILLTTKQDFDNEVKVNRKSPTRVDLKLLCEECESETFSVKLIRFHERKKTLCYSCSIGRRSWSYKEVKRFIETESECKLLSKTYNGVLEKLTVECYCGNPFKVPFHKFKNIFQRQCSNHNVSIQEEKIIKLLDELLVIYERQYKFDDCLGVNGKHLRFDFAIFKNDSLLLLLEYDGEQHFHAYDYWGGEEGLTYRQESDRIKDEYCKSLDIKLIRIPYWEKKNIEEIILRTVN